MQHITKIYRSKKIHRVEKVTQTGKYKLNLIESSDPFLPEALNQNTQKIEDAMTAHEEGIEQRLTVLEAHRFAFGTYQGNGNGDTTAFIPLPFTPKAVFAIVYNINNTNQFLMAVDSEKGNNGFLKLLKNGFSATNSLNLTHAWYNYIAFA